MLSNVDRCFALARAWSAKVDRTNGFEVDLQ
jgi:hypothetical protein